MSLDIEKHRTNILEVYNSLLDDNNPNDWALFGYESQTYCINVVSYGEEGLEELIDDLNASRIMYGLIRVTDPRTSRPKIVLINWQGEGAPNLQKGICARHLPDVKRMFKGVNITVDARTEEDVDETLILAAVEKATSTEYNFKQRSEHPEQKCPVGTNYTRIMPEKEINNKKRADFWHEQEMEEKARIDLEAQKRKEANQRLEKERIEREKKESNHREELNKIRNTRIAAEKKAEAAAMNSTTYGRSLSKEAESNANGVERDHEEAERSRRADLMRQERKKEAEALIGKKTNQTRYLFERGGSKNETPPTVATNGAGHAHKRPVKKLVEFSAFSATTQNEHKESSDHTEICPRKSIGKRWPPQADEEKAPQRTVVASVSSKVSNWAVANSPNVHSIQNGLHASSVKRGKDENPASFSSNFENANLKSEMSGSSNREPRQVQSQSSTSEPLERVTRTRYENIPDHGYSVNGSNGSHENYNLNNQISNTTTISPEKPAATVEAVPFMGGVSGDNGVTYAKKGVVSENGDKLGNNIGGTIDEDVLYGKVGGTSGHFVSMTFEADGIEYQLLPEHGLCARALYDYQAADDTEIGFDPGDIITNVDQIDVGWWQGSSPAGIYGLFPANYVELINGSRIH